MSRKDALAQFHKTAISEAAARLFQQKGIEATTMDDIAKEADYSKATLYVYFKSKDEMLHYIALMGMEMLLEGIESCVEDNESALDQYRAICGELLSMSDRQPLHFKIITETIASDEQSRKQTPVLEDIYQTGERINECLETVVKSGIAQGVFRSDLAVLPTGFFFWATLSGIIQMASNKQDYLQQRMGINKEQFLDISFQMLLRTVTKDGNDAW